MPGFAKGTSKAIILTTVIQHTVSSTALKFHFVPNFEPDTVIRQKGRYAKVSIDR